MNKCKLTLSAALLAATLPLLQGCFPVVVAGAAAGVMSVHDRRLTGVQTDDETTEWKGNSRIPPQYKDAHINFISYNRRVLVTGEVPNEEAKQAIGEIAGKIEGVTTVFNELTIGAASSFSSRSSDAYVSSKVKARLVDTQKISANHIKVFTEMGTTHLMGLVNEREAKLAINVARTTDGVRKVVNLFEVLPDAEIHRIDNALLGNPPKGPSKAAPVETR